jgi:hypothetical protein
MVSRHISDYWAVTSCGRLIVKAPPSELYQLCRELLLECEQFESCESLRSLCVVDELSFIKLQLKDAKSPINLFDFNFKVLFCSEHRLYGWIFPIFLKQLRDRQHPDDMLWTQLDDLCTKVEAWKNQPQACQQQVPQSEHKLFKLLLRIDFDEQEEAVMEVLDSPSYNKTAAFLVHGEEKFGQETLVTRLSQLSKLRNGRRIKIKVGGMEDISNLWNEVGKHLLDKNQTNWLPETKIIDQIFELLQTQHLIFIFSDAHRTYISFLPELIQEFWQPLVQKNNQRETYLAMFLVDNKGYICKSGLSLAWQVNHPDLPRIPLSLPPASRFPVRKLNEWVGMAVAAEVVPENLCVETLLEESQGGVPDLVYQRICYYCGFSWEGGLAKWLIQ